MKLTKLIMEGFKSFGDRTEFQFDEGISCIVGPNGCGKSNIVDAFKWVLGSQSAKALRGAEMMDVIFNGCATRGPAGCAEVVLVFDNADGVLQYEGASDNGDGDAMVSVSRRLYRSGQSEYLINNVPVRLRDIREMFMDTGVGVDAYSLIEQGRVEVFLQASREERRAIFDEAAGISKYKARKNEALRKLDRVEQNLLRITDILGEVEKRLRSIKYQAGKARNHQTYSQRLKELKSLFFLARYHSLHVERSALQRDLDSATDTMAAAGTLIDQLTASQSATQVESLDQERAARDIQGKIAGVGGQITTREERVDMLGARAVELGDEIVADSARGEELEAKIEDVQAELAARRGELSSMDLRAGELADECEAVSREHAAGRQAIVHLQDRLEDEKAGTMDLLRRTAMLHNEIHTQKARQDSLHGQRKRLSERAEQIDQGLTGMLTGRGQLDVKIDDVRQVLQDAQDKLDQARSRRGELDGDRQRLQDELASARERRSALLSRTETLQEMQARRDGVARGVRRVLDARQDGRLPTVRGMLGDFVQTDTRHAAVVEAALAGADQALLIERFDDLADGVLDEALGDAGTVQAFCLDRLETLRDDFDVSDCPQILGRVIDWVRFEPWLAPLMWRLLGRTYMVRSLSDARVAAAAAVDARFVTPDGRVLEPDGRVRIGPAGADAPGGVIARQSELVELAAAAEQIDRTIEQYQQRCESVHGEIEHLDETQQKLRTVIYEASTERVEAESGLRRIDEQIRTLQQERPVIAEDLRDIAEQISQAVHAEHEGREQAAGLERAKIQRQSEIDRLAEQVAAARRRHEELAGRITELKVAIAQTHEKKVALGESIRACEQNGQRLARDLAAARSEIDLNRRRRQDAEASIAEARGQIEQLYAQQQGWERDAGEIAETRRGLQEKLDEIRKLLVDKRNKHQEATDRHNGLRIQLGEIDVRIETVITRAADEMTMDLNSLYGSYEHDEQRDWDAVEAEINELRGKIERLGNVNLDAITEQDELDQRQVFLREQLDDVRRSRRQLDDLIRRINRESCEKFSRTFDLVRAGFQELFRKLFGGGRADVFLIDPDNVLESGIEVVAKPPGKELRSISLLSGGEKTMTALALLFSIFRSRPSPLCLLDEVDAALDEANNERFNALVADFVDDSQFLVITHAKRTMSMANVLYGVTMSEPGVSKRISVRFEEVGETLDEQLQPAGA